MTCAVRMWLLTVFGPSERSRVDKNDSGVVSFRAGARARQLREVCNVVQSTLQTRCDGRVHKVSLRHEIQEYRGHD
jgi:hypothetical protein